MIDFRAMTYHDGIDAVENALSRLTILRGEADKGVFGKLKLIMCALEAGNVRTACDGFHAMTALLASQDIRRVSGNIFTDFILDRLILCDNAFSSMAARGEADGVLYEAMRSELAILQPLATLDSETLMDWTRERIRETVKHSPGGPVRDTMSAMASAAWGGAPVKATPPARETAQRQTLMAEQPWLTWTYERGEMKEQYVCDEALEEIYARILESGDWRGAIDDIWNFHASYGSGKFLKSRYFIADGGRLVPMEETAAPETNLYEEQYNVLVDNAIAFMRSGRYAHTLITGGEGTGKTTLAMRVANDLPELRLVVVGERELENIGGYIAEASAQPLRFLFLLDGISPKTAGKYVFLPALPDNVMMFATAVEAEASSLFEQTVNLPYLPIRDYIECVDVILKRCGAIIEQDTVRSACIDAQADTRNKLTAASANVTANMLMSRNALR